MNQHLNIAAWKEEQLGAGDRTGSSERQTVQLNQRTRVTGAGRAGDNSFLSKRGAYEVGGRFQFQLPARKLP